jgi:hypothetical protein
MRFTVPGARVVPAFVAGLAISGAVAAAVAADAGDTINACASATGHLRVLQDGAACLPGETALSWSKSGKGPQGAAGPAGPAGPAGAKGDKGDKGLRGAEGAPGPAGPSGPEGQTGPEGLPGAQGPRGPAGGSGGGSALEYHPSSAAFTTSMADDLETEIPGTRFVLDVPENGLVAFGGSAESTLETTCEMSGGAVWLVDVEDPDLYLPLIHLRLRWSSPSGPLDTPMSALTTVFGRQHGFLRSLRADQRAEVAAAADAADDSEDLVINEGLVYYEPMSPGEHTIALVQYTGGYSGDSPCTDGQFTTRNRRLWADVKTPTSP